MSIEGRTLAFNSHAGHQVASQHRDIDSYLRDSDVPMEERFQLMARASGAILARQERQIEVLQEEAQGALARLAVVEQQSQQRQQEIDILLAEREEGRYSQFLQLKMLKHKTGALIKAAEKGKPTSWLPEPQLCNQVAGRVFSEIAIWKESFSHPRQDMSFFSKCRIALDRSFHQQNMRVLSTPLSSHLLGSLSAAMMGSEQGIAWRLAGEAALYVNKFVVSYFANRSESQISELRSQESGLLKVQAKLYEREICQVAPLTSYLSDQVEIAALYALSKSSYNPFVIEGENAVIEYENDHYRGDIKDNQPHGIGELTSQGRKRSELGNCFKGAYCSVYVGGFFEGRRHGAGMQKYKSDSFPGKEATLLGRWTNGKMCVFGVYTDFDGTRYLLQWIGGKVAGGKKSIVESADGRYHYIGSLSFDDIIERHGKGLVVKKDPAGAFEYLYEGEWEHNSQSGKGLEVYFDRDRRLDDSEVWKSFLGGMSFNGKKQITLSSGATLEATFVDGKPQGEGVYIWPEKDKRFEGHFENGHFKHGFFIQGESRVQGFVYEGKFYFAESINEAVFENGSQSGLLITS